MRIGELAKMAGVPVETVRFYEAKGLMEAPFRGENNYRVYGREHLARLHFIRHCRNLGLGLEDIARLIAFECGQTESCDEVHRLILDQIENVAARIRELELLRDHLTALYRRCPGHEKGRHCGILQGLERCEDCENPLPEGVCPFHSDHS